MSGPASTTGVPVAVGAPAPTQRPQPARLPVYTPVRAERQWHRSPLVHRLALTVGCTLVGLGVAFACIHFLKLKNDLATYLPAAGATGGGLLGIALSAGLISSDYPRAEEDPKQVLGRLIRKLNPEARVFWMDGRSIKQLDDTLTGPRAIWILCRVGKQVVPAYLPLNGETLEWYGVKGQTLPTNLRERLGLQPVATHAPLANFPMKPFSDLSGYLIRERCAWSRKLSGRALGPDDGVTPGDIYIAWRRASLGVTPATMAFQDYTVRGAVRPGTAGLGNYRWHLAFDTSLFSRSLRITATAQPPAATPPPTPATAPTPPRAPGAATAPAAPAAVLPAPGAPPAAAGTAPAVPNVAAALPVPGALPGAAGTAGAAPNAAAPAVAAPNGAVPAPGAPPAAAGPAAAAPAAGAPVLAPGAPPAAAGTAPAVPSTAAPATPAATPPAPQTAPEPVFTETFSTRQWQTLLEQAARPAPVVDVAAWGTERSTAELIFKDYVRPAPPTPPAAASPASAPRPATALTPAPLAGVRTP